MKYKNIKNLEQEEILKKMTECLNELFQLRMTKKLNQVTNPVKIRTLRRDIARLKTVLSQRRLSKDTNLEATAKN